MRKIYMLAMGLTLAGSISAQQVESGDFESMFFDGTNFGFPSEVGAFINPATGLADWIGVTGVETTNPITGSQSASIVSIESQNVATALQFQNPKMSGFIQQVYDGPLNFIDPNTDFSFTFNYEYAPAGVDTAFALVQIIDTNNAQGSKVLWGGISLIYGTTPSPQQGSINTWAQHNQGTPNQMAIVLGSSFANFFDENIDANVGSKFIVDDIVLTITDPNGGTCSAPTNVSVSGVGVNTATVTWAAGGSETSWEVVYGPAGFDIQDYLINGNPNVNLLTANNTTINLLGLSSDTEYDVYVFAVCNDGNSDATATVNFTTDPDGGTVCSAPTNISVSGVGVNTATVTWTAGGSETSWEVVYGPAGFDIQDYLINGNPNVNLLTENNTTANLTGLSANTGYDVYVFAVCGNDNSDVTAPINFKTDEEASIANYDFDNFKTHPNPASDVLNIELSNGETNKISIYGMDGSLVRTEDLNGSTAVNVRGLNPGIYMITVSTKTGEMFVSKFLKN